MLRQQGASLRLIAYDAIVVAADGSDGSWAPFRAAAGLAAGCDARLTLVHVADGEPEDRRRTVEEQLEEARDGRRGLKGLKALGSVSERLVHGAPCSVLLVPPASDLG